MLGQQYTLLYIDSTSVLLKPAHDKAAEHEGGARGSENEAKPSISHTSRALLIQLVKYLYLSIYSHKQPF